LERPLAAQQGILHHCKQTCCLARCPSLYEILEPRYPGDGVRSAGGWVCLESLRMFGKVSLKIGLTYQLIVITNINT
jgi:hypothetical protein